MFKKSPETIQYSLFSSPHTFLTGRSLDQYEKDTAWHNLFRQQVTMRIDEDVFSVLYSKGKGTPNSSIRILVAMMVLKEAEGISDQKLFENARFNMLFRSALGLLNIDAPVPTESTYYLFRQRIYDYAKSGNPNLLDIAFSSITKEQCHDFNVSGKRVRLDSKILGSNVAWLTRYELVHETVRVFYNEAKKLDCFDKATTRRLAELLKIEGKKIVFTCSSQEVKSRFKKLGELIFSVIQAIPELRASSYQILKRVFEEQFVVGEQGQVEAMENKKIKSRSIQSPHDIDCEFRNKDGNKKKGYTINVTESCDDDQEINLIGNVNVKGASASDVDFLQEDIKKVQEVFTTKTECAHADGAYNSPDNQEFCEKNNIELYLHAIQGAKGRYKLKIGEDGELKVFDTKTNIELEVKKIIGKNNNEKWRIQTLTGYRYFTQKEIEVSQIREKIENTPIVVLQKRNNVEATIFQLGYHYPNSKSRYRGLIKHQMWANMRCLWVNFVRISKFLGKPCPKTAFSENLLLNLAIKSFFEIPQTILTAVLGVSLAFSGNCEISRNYKK